MAESLKSVLMQRDNITSEEADELIAEAKEQMQEYLADGDTEAAYEVCSEMFGLEPDYLMDLMDF